MRRIQKAGKAAAICLAAGVMAVGALGGHVMKSYAGAKSVIRAEKTNAAVPGPGDPVTEQMIKSKGLDSFFTISELSDETFQRMYGKSFPVNGGEIKREDLRYLRTLYYDFKGTVRCGELVCNQAICEDMVAVFKELYSDQYPIESMRLVDDFEGDVYKSGAANNTSAFNYRIVTDGTNLSKHAYGLAIDVNPLYNPYVKFAGDMKTITYLGPVEGAAYADRSQSFAHKIDHNDPCYKAFKAHGFIWGGDWGYPDYMHFSKSIS